MKQLPLADFHRSLGAQFGEFAGWEMPLQYQLGAKKEALAVREHVGFFDVSHMAEFMVKGRQMLTFLDHLVPTKLKNWRQNQAIYTVCLDQDGLPIDDLILYRLGEDETLICSNASNEAAIDNWLVEQSKSFDVQVRNQSHEWCLLAVQGPESFEVLGPMLEDFSEMPRFGLRILQRDLIVARTGYTGEKNGVEVFCSPEEARDLAEKLANAGVAACGLVARDILRIEACLPLYGHELSQQIRPTEAGLSWLIDREKTGAIGVEALTKNAPRTRLLKARVEKAIARQGAIIRNQSKEAVGEVTSGTYSPLCETGIIMGLVKVNEPLESLSVEVRGKLFGLTRVKAKFTGKK